MMTKTNYYFRVLAAMAALAMAASLLISAARPAEAAFPGENGRIVFTSSRDGNHEIYARVGPLGNFGSLVQRITNNPAIDREPNVSPDGKRIVFHSNRDGGDAEIYVMNSDGSGQTRLTDNAAMDINATFSSDGKQIAFASYRDGNWDIYKMDSNGMNETNLTKTPAADEYKPNWSPDGTKIAFKSDREGNDEIYTMDALDGENPINLTNNPAEDGAPDFSPDGKKIVFDSDRDGAFNPEIYVMNSDGTDSDGKQAIRLTYNALPSPLSTDYDPAFSPDGKKIIFTSYRDGNNEVYRMDADGSNPTNLTKYWSGDMEANWQPKPN